MFEYKNIRILLIASIEEDIGRSQRRGRKAKQYLKAIDSILYYLKTGCGFRFIPQILWPTLYNILLAAAIIKT